MTYTYRPNSKFLNDVISSKTVLDTSKKGQTNLKTLLDLAASPNRSNRDWTAFIISALPMDTPEIRTSLLQLADDEDEDTRDEAIIGLARRDREEAFKRLLPLLKTTLGVVTLQAAEILADKRLVPLLRQIRHWEGDSEKTRVQLESAISACENGISADDWPNKGERGYVLSKYKK